ncbi:Zn-ribbon protein [Candidatus Scalindua japonica]|uniref:Zn-ribbon protein n=1 Tax=Candidatus Scalindua japonica TaxID=1284222 RepID=A0A286TXA2_9BACT|nr:C4-type zinc ribbon domain-containing protein [Candidatus Scalindua japonica]GAX60506.1 Zn-ribbon protein [Candidatus Scalindua japonica]
MIEKFEVLKRLQSLKNKINELEASQERMKQDVQKKKDQIENEKAVAEKKHEEKKSVQKEIDRKELDLKTNEGELTKYNVQLNSIKTNKEYSALVSEIGSKKADMSILEDEILNTMSRLETTNQEYEKATEHLRNEEESLKNLIKSVDAEIKEADEEIEKVKKEQEKYIDLLDEHSLKHYNRLSSIKGGKAIVPVIGNVCGGCFMNIRTQTLNALMSSKDLVFCQSCSRILYLDENND